MLGIPGSWGMFVDEEESPSIDSPFGPWFEFPWLMLAMPP